MTDPTSSSDPTAAPVEPAPPPPAAPAPPPATPPAPPTPTSTAPAGARPTGITILAILAAIGGVAGLFGGFVVLTGGALFFGIAGAVLGLAILAFAGLSLALAYGFWTIKPWAWPLGVVTQVYGIVINVLQVIGGDAAIASVIVSVAISAGILYYLFQPGIKSLFGRS